MSTKGIADVVFVIDASGSMEPCISALKANIASFASSLEGANAASFDLRLEFIAVKSDEDGGSCGMSTSRINGAADVAGAIYKGGSAQGSSKLWSGPAEFRNGLDRVEVGGNEDNLFALDTALDLPWRQANGCHRVVVLLTDEPPETGALPAARRARVPDLILKINDLRVKLFVVGPYSETFAELQAADGSDYLQIDDADVGNGLASVDFRKVMGSIAKSISVASLQASPKSVKRALFGQDRMTFEQIP
jgi:hypothetical protein